MTDSNLSPSAQAVLDASNLYPCYDSRQIIAATLRAAAERLGYMIYDYDNNEHPSVVNVADILAIADELENQ